MVKIKRGTSSTLRDVVLENGQPAYSKDTHELKIGDGDTSFSNLPAVGNNIVRYTLTVDSTGWKDTSKTFAGVEAKYSNTCNCQEVDETSNVIEISYNGGDLKSAQTWSWLSPEKDSVVLYSKVKPTNSFSLDLFVSK